MAPGWAAENWPCWKPLRSRSPCRREEQAVDSRHSNEEESALWSRAVLQSHNIQGVCELSGGKCCCRALEGRSWWKGLNSASITDCLSGSWQGWTVSGRGCSFICSLPTPALPCGETALIDTAALWVAWAANLYCRGTTSWAGGRQGDPDLPAAQEDQEQHAIPLLMPHSQASLHTWWMCRRTCTI